mmetsp:Transcript_80286/g.126624  ORF Transcript_80286/g.126624 Transcript_80286/m.126624 type:complete len:206 (-) Transcript_80286:103-720(-)
MQILERRSVSDQAFWVVAACKELQLCLLPLPFTIQTNSFVFHTHPFAMNVHSLLYIQIRLQIIILPGSEFRIMVLRLGNCLRQLLRCIIEALHWPFHCQVGILTLSFKLLFLELLKYCLVISINATSEAKFCKDLVMQFFLFLLDRVSTFTRNIIFCPSHSLRKATFLSFSATSFSETCYGASSSSVGADGFQSDMTLTSCILTK